MVLVLFQIQLRGFFIVGLRTIIYIVVIFYFNLQQVYIIIKKTITNKHIEWYISKMLTSCLMFHLNLIWVALLIVTHWYNFSRKHPLVDYLRKNYKSNSGCLCHDNNINIVHDNNSAEFEHFHHVTYFTKHYGSTSTKEIGI
jgi:hypothetical protein